MQTQHTTNDIPLCQCGCGQPAPLAKRSNVRLGHVKGQPVRFIQGHHNKIRPLRPAADRFWAKVDKRAPDECWHWLASDDGHGYGTLRIDGHHVKAHRLSYELHYGPIPDGLEILHICDNPPCVNPAHLVAGTHKENMIDSISKGRASMPPSTKGKRSGSARFTDEQIAGFRSEFADLDISVQKFAHMRGVPLATMWRIIKGKMYQDV